MEGGTSLGLQCSVPRGGASAAAAELQDTYAPELVLSGSYAGAVPAELPALAKSAEGNALVDVLGYFPPPRTNT